MIFMKIDCFAKMFGYFIASDVFELLKNMSNADQLRGPAAILFISRDTLSDSIAKCFRACFPGVSHKYRVICCKMGYRTDMSV